MYSLLFIETYNNLYTLQKELYSMNKTNYISVGIDAESAFSFISIVDSQERASHVTAFKIDLHAKLFWCKVDSIYSNIQLKLDVIDCLDLRISRTMERFDSLQYEYENHTFVNQIRLLDTISGAGLLTVVLIICKHDDFQHFSL